MSETFMSMADARRVAEGRKKIIDDLKKRIEILESENKRLKSILKEYGINTDLEDKPKAESSPLKDKLRVHGLRAPTAQEVEIGKAQWCWTCGNAECLLSKHDILMMCLLFEQRSEEDMQSDPHFGGHGNE